ncbi:MAG TPA: glyoxalase [Bacteroidales bacterium]|jgi:predicted enzyme related to lactoylglutathione lyase|nr:glyoxalase [Bacteroidales bacterium]
MKNNSVGWFEIPVENMERAKKFYEAVLGGEISLQQVGDERMGWFPYSGEGHGAPGSLVMQNDYSKPGISGVRVYFTSPSGNCGNELSRVEPAGGKVIIPRTLISEDNGYYGLFLDTEGNYIGVHSQK